MNSIVWNCTSIRQGIWKVWYFKGKYEADVIAYVIMPNHLHVIMYFKSDGFNLNKIIANGKWFMAYEIINRLKNKGNLEMLIKLSSLVTRKEKRATSQSI